MNDRGTKRFNLRYTQQDAIRIVDRDNEKAWLNAPFTEPMNSLLSSLSGYSPFLYERKNGKGAARCLKTEEEYDKWASNNKDSLVSLLKLQMPDEYDIMGENNELELSELQTKIADVLVKLTVSKKRKGKE